MMIKLHTPLAFAFLFASIAVSPGADDKKPVYTDPSKVDEDFAFQGEFAGKIDGEKTGAQVIADGEGKFTVVLYPGGLPGAGWDKEKAPRRGQGERNEKRALLQAGDWQVVVRDDSVRVRPKGGGKRIGKLDRVERKSPTLGKKAPEGAVVLFDGSNTDAWKGGKMTEDGLLMQGAMSKDTFRDFSVHMEFRTPYKPKARGQGRGNSGFYAQGRYEVQILDSFGLAGKDNECGGIYSVGAPAVNMCFPPLSWQTYDVDFTAAKYNNAGKKVKNARITVRHNGIVVHDDVEADHSTTASPLKEGPEAGPVFFQDHGNPIRFRNVWVVKK